MNKSIWFLLSIVLFLTINAEAQFRLHINNSPSTLDPHKQRTGASSYLLSNLHRHLLKVNAKGDLVPDLADKCTLKAKTVTCLLRENLLWSDGKPLTGEDFLRSYRRILASKTLAPRADLLFAVKGAREFYQGNSSSLGIRFFPPRTLSFQLNEEDPDFLYHLANYILSPYREDAKVTSGPYRIKKIENGKSYLLENNPHYWLKQARPEVEFLIIAEDSVALNLYEKGRLDFLRRLPTALIPAYKKSSDFVWAPIVRFDYIGFNLKKVSDLKERRALSQALNFAGLKKLYHSEGMPGCPGLLPEWFENSNPPCVQFKEQSPLKLKAIPTFYFSLSGGDDHKRLAEWLQNQWSQNLKVDIKVKGYENKLFNQKLEEGSAEIFRKGVPLDKLSCFHALSIFQSESRENFVGLKSPAFDNLMSKLKAESSSTGQKKLCSQALNFLLEEAVIIPTGPIHFAMLASPKYSGWFINPLNILDLSELKSSTK